MWKQWVNSILGAAIVVAPFLGLTTATLAWSLVVMGLAVLVLSVWALGELPKEEYDRAMHEVHMHSHA